MTMATARDWIKNNKALLAIVLVLVTVVIMALLPASKLLINESCEPEGIIAKLKSFTHGRDFWARQVEYLDKQIQYLESTPERWEKLQARIEEMSDKNEQRLENLYEKYPKSRPSANEVLVSQLRTQADKIEDEEIHAKIREIQMKRIEELNDCRPVLLQRAK